MNERVEIERMKIFGLAVAIHGVNVSTSDIDDVEGYIFDRREPRSQFVRAVLMDSLSEAIADPPRWYRGILIFVTGRRQSSTPDLRALKRFVDAAVPMEAIGLHGYCHWLAARGWGQNVVDKLLSGETS